MGRHNAFLSLAIAALCLHGFSEGYPFASRHKRSGGGESAVKESDAGIRDDPPAGAPHPSSADSAAGNDEAPPERLPSGDAPLDDGLIPSLGNKKQGEGGGGLFPSLPSLPSLPGGGGGGGGGGGLVGPIAVLGGFTALLMPLGGPLLNNLPGALSSFMGMMPNAGSLPTLPGPLGGSSSG